MADRAESKAERLPRVVALVWVTGPARPWLETLQTLALSDSVAEIRVVVSATEFERLSNVSPTVVRMTAASFAEAMATLLAADIDQILVVSAPLAAPRAMLARASDWMVKDLRLATVSFLSNSAGHLSFPYRNTPTPFGIQGHDENTLTTALRAKQPDSGPVPITVPAGAAVLVSALAMRHAGGVTKSPEISAQMAIAEFAAAAAAEGFSNCLDAGTYLTQPQEWADGPPPSGLSPEECEVLSKSREGFTSLYADDQNSIAAPVAQALDLARAKAEGLRILIDGSCLGPQEMGTQLLVMALTKALSRRSDVRMVCLAVPDPNNLPSYVQDVRTLPKIGLVQSDRLEFPGAPDVDVIHRPYQPDYPIPWARWRSVGRRSLITIQDLIAYRNGAYFLSSDEWLNYRANLAEQVSQADGVVSISHDVVGSIREERLRIADDRLFVIQNGIDYRDPDGRKSPPAAIIERNWEDAPLFFVLGATYFHKNRDLAIKVWQGLRRRGHPHKLILAGANVPRGSTRYEEARLLAGETDVLKLPDISGPERDWLMSRTSLVLYPTSAEGFGQLPFEAARFKVPALYVAFGPLAELIDDPDAPRTFDIEALIERADRLISDPDIARQAVDRTMGKLSQLTWDGVAAKSVEAYFSVLSQIPNPG